MVEATTPVCTKCEQHHGGFRVRRDRTFVHINCEEEKPDDLFFWWDLSAEYFYWFLEDGSRWQSPRLYGTLPFSYKSSNVQEEL